MKEHLKNISLTILGLIGVVAIFALIGGFLAGIELISEFIYPWLVRVSEITLAIVIFILLPNAVFSSQPRFAAIGMLIAALIFGATLWVFSVIVTFELWGGIALAFGLIILGGGVFPIALLAALFKGNWPLLGEWLLLATLVVSLGVWSEYLLKKVRQNEPIGPELQEASSFTQGEVTAKMGIPGSWSHFNFSAIRWRMIALVLIVATSGAAGGYWYKDFESHNIPDNWIEIRDTPDELSSRVPFDVDHIAMPGAESPGIHKIKIKVENIQTAVKFATARFDRTEDAELLYRGSLGAVISSHDLDMKDDSLIVCNFYLTFALYDKDDFFLVGLIGPRETLHFEHKGKIQGTTTIEGTVEEVIPRQMARRTAIIKHNVNFDKCE